MNPPPSFIVLAAVLLSLAGLPGGSAISRRPVRGGGLRDQEPSTTSGDDSAAEDERVEALVDRACAGDPLAFGELFEHFHGPIYRQLYFLTRSTAVAEDLTSETFFRALRAMRRAQMPGPYFGPWLRKIARNLAMDHVTSRTTRSEHVTDDFSWWPEVGVQDAAITATVESDAMRRALSRLPESQRRVLTLRFLCQLSVEETAREVGCTHGAAKQLQWRGLRNLERVLGEQEVH